MADLFRHRRQTKAVEEEGIEIAPIRDQSFFDGFQDHARSLRPILANSLLQNKTTSLREKVRQIKRVESLPEPCEEIAGLEEEPEVEVEAEEPEEGQRPKKGKSFGELGLIKPLLRASAQLGYMYPTPIQTLSIPVIMSGKDVFCSAQTGTGKTAAFLLPILQRYYRAQPVNYIRALVVVPTRELAIQCFTMLEGLNKYCRVQNCLVIGASNLKQQETDLRNMPCLVVGTPGRIVDHLVNSRSVSFDHLEMLVFDEADKLLEQGFEKEVNQIVNAAGERVQTILLSATVGGAVERLVQLSMRRPIRLAADPDSSTARKLVQKIVRLRDDEEGLREAVLLSIVKAVQREKTIVFFRTKREAHRFACIMHLKGLNPAELHGNMSQAERIRSFDQFRRGECNVLLATDLAARGLDIKEVKYVINNELPNQLTRYIHRVGRTARAGKNGVSITICSDKEALRLKKMMRKTGDKVLKLNLTREAIERSSRAIAECEFDLERLGREEKEEAQLRRAEMEVNKVENIERHKEEIESRPPREWVCSQREKRRVRTASRQAELQGDLQ